MGGLHAVWVESRRGLRAAAVSTCRRRAVSLTAAVSSSSAAVLSCSCCASMYQTSARSRGRSELALHRRRQLICPSDPVRGGEAAGSLRADVPGSRTHPAPPLVASCRCSVCSRCCSQLSRAPCTGGRAPVSGAFAAAALLRTAFVAWALRSSHPMLDPRFIRIPAFRHGVGHYHDHLLRDENKVRSRAAAESVTANFRSAADVFGAMRRGDQRWDGPLRRPEPGVAPRWRHRSAASCLRHGVTRELRPALPGGVGTWPASGSTWNGRTS